MLVQVVATNREDKCPVALTEFTKDGELAFEQLQEFKKNGYGRERTHPNLRIRDFDGRDVVSDSKPTKKAK